MKQILEASPFVLLLGLAPHYFLNSPNIAQSIIVLAISALCGFRLYCLSKETPDYVSMFKKDFDEYKSQRDEEMNIMKERHEKAMVYLEGQVKELNTNYGKVTMENATKRSTSNFKF